MYIYTSYFQNKTLNAIISYSFCTEYWIHIHQSSTYVFLLDPHSLVSRKSFPLVCNFHFCCPMAVNNASIHLWFEYELLLNFFKTKNFIIESIWYEILTQLLYLPTGVAQLMLEPQRHAFAEGLYVSPSTAQVLSLADWFW